MSSRVEGFPPIASERSKALILGTMPSVVSLRTRQYYANPRNIFWPIMGELFGAGRSLPYAERVEILRSVGVALWDVLQVCVRPGSLDASITEEVANDFPAFFAEHPSITHVFFNGKGTNGVLPSRAARVEQGSLHPHAPAIDQSRPRGDAA